jgi:hypothetical protein
VSDAIELRIDLPGQFPESAVCCEIERHVTARQHAIVLHMRTRDFVLQVDAERVTASRAIRAMRDVFDEILDAWEADFRAKWGGLVP